MDDELRFQRLPGSVRRVRVMRTRGGGAGLFAVSSAAVVWASSAPLAKSGRRADAAAGTPTSPFSPGFAEADDDASEATNGFNPLSAHFPSARAPSSESRWGKGMRCLVSGYTPYM